MSKLIEELMCIIQYCIQRPIQHSIQRSKQHSNNAFLKLVPFINQIINNSNVSNNTDIEEEKQK